MQRRIVYVVRAVADPWVDWHVEELAARIGVDVGCASTGAVLKGQAPDRGGALCKALVVARQARGRWARIIHVAGGFGEAVTRGGTSIVALRDEVGLARA